MTTVSQHTEWLSLIDISGPFLNELVLKRIFPQGLEGLDTSKHRCLRQAYDEWRETLERKDSDWSKIHAVWIELVLRQGLGLDKNVFKSRVDLPEDICRKVPEHGITLRPDFAVVNDRKGSEPLMLVAVYDPEVPLDEPIKGGRWTASPSERMVELCRGTGVRLGLLTNGECWMFVDAPVGVVTSFASWYARLWGPEPKTLQAFVNLLGIRRFFVDRSEQLPALLDESLKLQDEVTDALGEQVRYAVEVIIQALDQADVDRNRELLEGVEPTELYEAGLTVMMRIVFLLSAEERGLLLLGDERYESNYAISTLRMQLLGESEEILERRWDAWSRLLATFRAVYGGIEHEALRLPALGGSLFDPDRFPFLEGRAKGSLWKTDPATPLPIDNRTVLLLLNLVQLFQGRTLSYRALDVEQIGHVYEGLLECTVVRAKEVTLDLDATKNAKKPWVSLEELDEAVAEGEKAVHALLKERTGSSASRVKNDLAKEVDETAANKLLLTACHGDQALRDRIRPYFHLLRINQWGYPLIYPENTFMVATGTDRRETGTHYTPKSLTETIVKEALEPLAYIGPEENKPREEWQLKSPAELLELKICDPAMGSGAFLVQVCRWLSERLVEAWGLSEDTGNSVTSSGVVVEKSNDHEPLRAGEERLITARSLIAERCLYGVDVNPLAVELAKLSIWLVTLAKGRPFGFLDHNLRCGDSLLGIHNLDQLHYLDMSPKKGSSKKLFAQTINQAVGNATKLRLGLRNRPIRDIRDVEFMARLDEEARKQLELPELIADALVGEVLVASGKSVDTTLLSIEVGGVIEGNNDKAEALKCRVIKGLKAGLAANKPVRRTFHWPLEFPEVFRSENEGFDAMIGNPPFQGGLKISERSGEVYIAYLGCMFPASGRVTDLCAYFFRRSAQIIGKRRLIALLATSTIAEGVTRKAGLSFLASKGFEIIFARKSFAWPGKASVFSSLVILFRGNWAGDVVLDGSQVQTINSHLEREVGTGWEPLKFKENKGYCYPGVYPWGEEFVITENQACDFINQDDNNSVVIRPLLGGKEISGSSSLSPVRYIVDMGERSEEEAAEFEAPFEYLRRHIQPKRSTLDPVKYRRIVDGWWKFFISRQRLYKKIKDQKMKNVLGRTRTSDYHIIEFLPADIVHLESAVIFLFDDFPTFGVLQSVVHEIWSRTYGSTLGNGLRYVGGTCFDTFPFPVNYTSNSCLYECAKRFQRSRKNYCEDNKISRADFVKFVLSSSDGSASIETFRVQIIELDQAVLAAYGWDDISCDHDLYTWNNKTWFTVSESCREQILKRTTDLNRARHEIKQCSSDREEQNELAFAAD